MSRLWHFARLEWVRFLLRTVHPSAPFVPELLLRKARLEARK